MRFYLSYYTVCTRTTGSSAITSQLYVGKKGKCPNNLCWRKMACQALAALTMLILVNVLLLLLNTPSIVLMRSHNYIFSRKF